MDLSLDVGLLETTRTTGNGGNRRSGKGDKSPLEEFIKKLRGPAGTVASYCSDCGRPLSDGLVSLAESRELFAAHLKEVHPEKKPRDIRSIREECDRRKKEEEARKAKERKAREKKARAASPEPKKASKSGRKSGPPNRQPILTGEMVNEAVRMYTEKKSVLAIAELRYEAWGFSSPWMLRRALYGPLRDHEMIVRRGNHSRITSKQIETAKRLHEEEGLPTIEIAERFYKEWGYSLRGLRHKLDRIFKDPERHIDPKPRYMTPERVEVAWHLYSQGNFTPAEISEISRDFWGFAGNTIGDAMNRAGYKLRANRWDNDGSRPISEEEAIGMIKAVA